MQRPKDAKPLFHVQTKCKNVGITVLINFFASKIVSYPDLDYDEAKLVQEFLEHGPDMPSFKLPFKSGQMFWSKRSGPGREYVVDILINDKWAIQKVLKSNLVLHATVTVAMLGIEKKFNGNDSMNPREPQPMFQHIGHKLDLDFRYYDVKSGQIVEPTRDLVIGRMVGSDDVATPSSPDHLQLYVDLYYRPKSKFLTCQIFTEKLPDSIAFNDDRIVIKNADETLLDTYLPFYIDLSQPVKYKFDEKANVFRAVFKVLEVL